MFLKYFLKLISLTPYCYKFYEKDFFLNEKIQSNGFEADHEITIKLLKSSYKIIEVPISYNPRTVKDGKKIRFIDAFIAFYVLIKFKFTKR